MASTLLVSAGCATCCETSRGRVHQLPVGLPEHQRLTFGGSSETDEATHRGRLAGTVGAEESADRAGLHRERDVVDGGDVAVAFGEVLELDHESSTPQPAGS